MTTAERKMVLYLIYDGGCDTCSRCIHRDKPTCWLYNEKTGYCDADREPNDDYCISGMVEYFERANQE